jgi:predicted alpha-1,2-mannosidase
MRAKGLFRFSRCAWVVVLAAGCAAHGGTLVDSGGNDAPAADLAVGQAPVDASADRSMATPPDDAADAGTAIDVGDAAVGGPDRPGNGMGTPDLPLTQYVNPFIGTQAAANTLEAGNTTPAAMVPFGMVQLGPDTTSDSGGYRYNQNALSEFSMTRYSGRAFASWLDVGILPTTGFNSAQPSPGTNWNSYAQTFKHGSPNEVATAGFYHVHLDSKNIDVDLTATDRTGFARFTFPAGAVANVFIRAAPSANGAGAVVAGDTGLIIDAANRMVTGSVKNNGSVTYKVYFALVFDRAWTGGGTWNGATNQPNIWSASNGTEVGGWLNFDTQTSQVVQAKIGISFVSVANAQGNLASENDPTQWAAPADFDTVKAKAAAAWNARLNAIQVTGGATNDLTTFYTALYHAHIHPNIFSDANGQYLGFDDQVHNTMPGHRQYHNIAGWDISRTQSAFLGMLAPAEAADIANSLANDAAQDTAPACLPRWQQAATDSRGMIGDGGSIIAANIAAYAGTTGYDTDHLLTAMYNGATDPTAKSRGTVCREGLSGYLSKGYVGLDTSGGAASITLEYAHTDFAIAQFAKALGDVAKFDAMMTASRRWRNLWKADAASLSPRTFTGYLVPRNADGTFVAAWDPTVSGPRSNDEWFREGNGSQYLWMVEHDRASLVDLLGGRAAAAARLQDHFGLPTDSDAPRSVNALINHTVHAYLGNEPGELTPQMFAYVGQPNRGAEVWRRMLVHWYPDAPTGNPANDDGGSMGSWVVMASLGINHAIPGIAGFVLGSPRFPSAILRLAGGTLAIRAPAASDTNLYVQSVTWNGSPYQSTWLPWDTIKGGGALDFVVSGDATSTWGTADADAPPSFP